LKRFKSRFRKYSEISWFRADSGNILKYQGLGRFRKYSEISRIRKDTGNAIK